jgi:hypothetical protein
LPDTVLETILQLVLAHRTEVITMRHAACAVLPALFLVACSSGGGGTTPQQGSTCDPCDTSNSQQGQPVATNPYGDPYPTKGLGNAARGTDSMGNLNSKPGDVARNLKWVGYPGANVSSGFKPIQLADYYDPHNKQWEVLHIAVAAYWCGPCNQETDATVPVADQLKQKKVAFLQALNDGPVTGKPATTTDLSNWITRHNSNFTEMLDPEQENVGQLFTQPSIPLNVYIDVRSMEILQAYEGAPQDANGQVTSQAVLDDAQRFLDWVGSHPATQY